MKKTDYPLLLAAIASLLAAAILPGATGCRGPDVSLPPGIETTRTVQQTQTTPETTVRTFGRDAAGYLHAELKADLESELQAAARKAGFYAALVRPDAEASQVFLVVAPDRASAEMLNGFFFWLDDPDAPPAGMPGLVLCVAQLFSEQNRLAALADGQYSDKRVVGLLDMSLGGILGLKYSPDILAFILECYRREFASRLDGGQQLRQIWRQTINGIEVTYESSIFSTVSFRELREET